MIKAIISVCTMILLFCGKAIAQDIIINVPVSQKRLLEADAGENISTDDPGSIILGQEISVEGGSPEYTYKWTDPDGNMYDSQTISGNSFGSYYLMVTDNNNCSALDSVQVLNNTSIDRQKEGELLIYPNPSSGMVNLPVRGLGQSITIEIYSEAGKKVFAEQIKNSEKPDTRYMDLGFLGTGIFFINLDDGQKTKTATIILN